MIELFGTGNIFTIVWTFAPNHCSFKVYQLLNDVVENDKVIKREYAAKDWNSLPKDSTTELEEAEEYMSGLIKWDGCSEIKFEDHLCGAFFFKEHIKLLEHLYREAMSQMGSDEDPWDDKVIV